MYCADASESGILYSTYQDQFYLILLASTMTTSAPNAPDESMSANAAQPDAEPELPEKNEGEQVPNRVSAPPETGDGDSDRVTKKV
jgi:hypothetical protein